VEPGQPDFLDTEARGSEGPTQVVFEEEPQSVMYSGYLVIAKAL
jgi:hypothetical protein